MSVFKRETSNSLHCKTLLKKCLCFFCLQECLSWCCSFIFFRKNEEKDMNLDPKTPTVPKWLQTDSPSRKYFFLRSLLLFLPQLLKEQHYYGLGWSDIYWGDVMMCLNPCILFWFSFLFIYFSWFDFLFLFFFFLGQ